MRSRLVFRPTIAISCLLGWSVFAAAPPLAAEQSSRPREMRGALPAAVTTAGLGTAGSETTAAVSRSAVPGRPRLASAPSLLQPIPAPATASIIYDDGTAESAYLPPIGMAADFAMRFDLPRSNMRVDQVKVCLQREGTDPNLDFDIVFWEADGPGGSPGTLIDFVGATALNVPSNNGAFFEYSLSFLNLVMPSSTVYVGVGWDDGSDPDFAICVDQSVTTPVQPGYVDIGQDGSFENLSDIFSSYRALMLRGVFSDLGPTGPCVADDTTMCLLGGRFQVEVDWATSQGTSGPGHVVPFGSDRAGMFWFFNSENWEMLIKMLNACTLDPPRFWVFFAATTNVEFTLTVTDTETGFPRVYHNDQGHRADAVTDTGAFATCP